MDKSLIIKRLTSIKLLYRLGLNLSYQSENTSHFSILSFHDSIEMFLKLAAEEKGIDSTKFSFLTYWDNISGLTLKGQMQSLNANRVGIKHKGQIPGKIEIESARVYSTDFFIENTPLIFGVEFSEISLFDLMTFANAREKLKNSQKELDENRIESCVPEVTMAFYHLIDEYKETKKNLYSKTHFDFVEKIHYSSDAFKSENCRTDSKIKKAIEGINKNFENLEKALEIIALGIDFRKYTKFNILTPPAYALSNGSYHIVESLTKKNWTKENCQFLIDFVLDSALKLQDFDFNFDSLDSSRSEIIKRREQLL